VYHSTLGLKVIKKKKYPDEEGDVPHQSTQANRIKGRFRVCTGMGDVQSAQWVALLRDQAVLLTFGVFPGQ